MNVCHKRMAPVVFDKTGGLFVCFIWVLFVKVKTNKLKNVNKLEALPSVVFVYYNSQRQH